MKQYEFHSALPPEEVFARLGKWAKEGGYVGWLEVDEFFYHRKGERFRLDYAGLMPNRIFIPFYATVCAEGTGSAIAGGFSVFREFGIPTAVVSVISCLLSVVRSGKFSLSYLGFFAAFPFVLLGVIYLLNVICFRVRRKTILRFIEDHLLK